MTSRTFYRLALLLPVVVPALVTFESEWRLVPRFLAALGMTAPALGTSEDLDILAAVTMTRLWWQLAGYAYVVFALALAWWMRDQSSAAIRRMMFRTPPLFIPVAYLGMVIQGLIAGTEDALGNIGFFVWLSVMILITGYMYVGVVELVRVVLRVKG